MITKTESQLDVLNKLLDDGIKPPASRRVATAIVLVIVVLMGGVVMLIGAIDSNVVGEMATWAFEALGKSISSYSP